MWLPVRDFSGMMTWERKGRNEEGRRKGDSILRRGSSFFGENFLCLHYETLFPTEE
jgi:hypothetical protein